MKSLSLSCGVLALGLTNPAIAAGIHASVDSDRVAPGETIELTLVYDGQVSSQPDVTPLARDFDVLSTSRGSTVRIVDGAQSAETQIRLTLSPKRAGKLTIPALGWQSAQTSPIVITVDGSGPSQTGTTSQAQSSNAFLKTTVDDSHPYVQGAVKLTVRLYAGVHLYDASLALPASSDVLVEQFGKDRSSSTELNGHRYEVIERDYLLFPQHSGALEIPGPVLDARVPTRSRSSILPDDSLSDLFDQSFIAGMMQTAKPIRIHGDNIAIHVRPRPAIAATSYWIPAKNLSVTSERHPNSLEVPTGEPITLDLRMRAEGLTAAQLPDIASLLRLPPGLNAYPNEPKLENTAQNGTVIGTREQSIALIADRAGNFDVPAVNIQWWDTGADQLRKVELPSLTIKALPVASGNNATPGNRADERVLEDGKADSMQQSSAKSLASAGSWHWRWISISGVVTLLVLGAIVRWWRFRKRVSAKLRPAAVPKRNLSLARRDFLAACKLNDPRGARRALLHWARVSWPDAPPAGLRDIAAHVEDSEFRARLQELDRACFAGDSWTGSALSQAFERLPGPSNKKHTTRRFALTELYPQT